MARLIFIFPIILVCFLTIVSKSGLSEVSSLKQIAKRAEIITAEDTLIFSDDFENGRLSGWTPSDEWEVSASEKINGNFSMRHSAKAASGVSAVFHAAKGDWNGSDVKWSFKLKNGNWDPSSSNRFWFYLSADTTRTELVNGWAVGVNISGSNDLLSLWRIRNGKADSLIVQTDLDWNASTMAAIGVKRTARGVWSLEYQEQGKAKSKSFTGNDPATFNFRNVGLYFNYTPTRAGQLWLDDFVAAKFSAGLYIQKLTLINSHLLTILFNMSINPASVHSGNFKLSDENQSVIPVTKAVSTTGTTNSVDISFGQTSGVELSLSVSGVTDLTGKAIIPDTRSFSYFFSPEVGSVLINEILFNPFSGGVDFVELVNVSETSIPLHRLMLATRNDTLALKQIYPVSTEKRYLKPGQFLCCTKDPAIVASQYITNNPESFCQMKSFPSYPDDAGTVVLLNDSLKVIDEFSYTAKMHSPFMADVNGVSLERISLEKPTADRSNWASATASVGFATPGMPNSQTKSETEIQEEITPEPQAFSPNNDGYNDELTIRFKLSKPGYIANVRIFDIAGRQVAFLVKNQSLAQEGSWIWKGDNDSEQKQTIGVYIVLVELFDQEGHTKTFKKTCTITDRLN